MPKLNPKTILLSLSLFALLPLNFISSGENAQANYRGAGPIPPEGMMAPPPVGYGAPVPGYQPNAPIGISAGLPSDYGAPPPPGYPGMSPAPMPFAGLPPIPSGAVPAGEIGYFPDVDPNDPVQQALSLHQAGRYADAIQIYESIIINNAPDPRLYASVSDAHFRLGNNERAMKYIVEALKLDPNYSSGHLLLGTILSEMGDYVRAVRSYERVIALDQNNPYAYYNLGLLYYKKADINNAIAHLERARDLNPNDPKIWNNLGVAYYDHGEFMKASGSYAQALGLDPTYTLAAKNMELVQDKISAMTPPAKKIISKKRSSKKRIVAKKK
ncbi:MAG: tetratricopeptide repeat protein [Candidatus Caenarcaniphilales bacterium]|nr:tetratricopeptide repeat protein [Candidatus Caenarcaniphilales bacterium]